MKRITNKSTANGYRFSAGRQSKKLTAEVTRVGTRWSMALPNGQRVARKTIGELKNVFSEFVEANYGKKFADIPVSDPVPPKVEQRRPTPPAKTLPVVGDVRPVKGRCPMPDCINPKFWKYDTCLSCRFEMGNAAAAATA